MAQGVFADEEDEWEYEYDPTETEDFYVTVDLANTPAATTKKNAIKNPFPDPRVSRAQSRTQRQEETATGDQEESASPSPDAPDQAQDEAQAAPTSADEIRPSIEHAANSDPQDRIQILELHGPNPLINYQNQLYSCRWANSIGTDLFFAKSSDTTDRTVLRSLATYDLLGISSAKLVATSAHLQPRKRQRLDEDAEQPAMGADDDAGDAAGVVRADEAARKKQAKFLERLDAAKARRGERGRV
ncbi:hypothetical protein H2201_004688 [Coniosporium apollinis]|uniref:Transcription factor TFIIIC triple barrel domain-containing protein n=2 Tax=Coniosporium TaxID=2810619 RepID=A0ABQ9NS34_9PEZI|nr:hypothetical protein H2199_000628 [Cladosporium sp. JES 115]KAJ9665214.1 hypothetical protein H2201_004688 [Coniosporium apollinis]